MMSTPEPVIVLNTSALETISNDSQTRYCWVCFATDEDDATLKWVQPCNCRGTTKWVHQSCLQRWVDEKLKDNIFGHRVRCPQCQTEYVIVFPSIGIIVLVLDGAETVVKKISPILAAGVVVMSVYWTAVTYGAITVMQVFGHKEGIHLMESRDPLLLLVSLPTIPVGLVLIKMLRWEDSVLSFLRRNKSTVKKIPVLRTLLPIECESTINTPPLTDPVSATRVLMGALLLPTVAVMVGNIMFDHIENNLHRTILGGVTYMAVKGALMIFHKQHLIARRSKREILDYTEENIAMYSKKPTNLSIQSAQVTFNEQFSL